MNRRRKLKGRRRDCACLRLGLLLLIGPLCFTGCGREIEGPMVATPMAQPAAVPPIPKGVDVLDHLARFERGDEGEVEAMVERLLPYMPRPWTVDRLLAGFATESDERRRAALIYLLAASKDPKGAKVVGEALDDDELDVRLHATWGLYRYWVPLKGYMSLEALMDVVREWWTENRTRILEGA